jgi:hypothetical protein
VVTRYDPTALCGSRTEAGYSGRLLHPLGWQDRATSLGSLPARSLPRSERHISRRSSLLLARPRVLRHPLSLQPRPGLTGSGWSGLSRLFAWQGSHLPKVETHFVCLPCRPLVRPLLLATLLRASRVLFRSSSFTAGERPSTATLQGLTACLNRLWSFPLISSSRLVAHRSAGLRFRVASHVHVSGLYGGV